MTARPFRDDVHRDAALLKWLRREVNRDLRYWRSYPGIAADRPEMPDLIADCKAKLGLIGWAERWQCSVREGSPAARPDVQATMLSHLALVNGAMRYVAAGYSGRDGWRREWGQS